MEWRPETMETVLQGGDMVRSRHEEGGEDLPRTEVEAEIDGSGEALGNVLERGL